MIGDGALGSEESGFGDIVEFSLAIAGLVDFAVAAESEMDGDGVGVGVMASTVNVRVAGML